MVIDGRASQSSLTLSQLGVSIEEFNAWNSSSLAKSSVDFINSKCEQVHTSL